jgi:succinate-semialdehyde dehydrogenase/glutarate-semialdehyde dehydrogenase
MAIASINPASGETVKTFQALGEAEIEQKLQRAVAEITFLQIGL